MVLTLLTLFVGCTEGDIRLFGGATSMEGHVEICINDEWRTVCDSMWDDMDANVVCKQLGWLSVGKSEIKYQIII